MLLAVYIIRLCTSTVWMYTGLLRVPKLEVHCTLSCASSNSYASNALQTTVPISNLIDAHYKHEPIRK